METNTLLLPELNNSQADQTNRTTKDRFERAVLLMDQHVHAQKDGTFILDAAAQHLDIEPDVFSHLTASLQHGNTLARLGRAHPQSQSISFLRGPGGGDPGNGGSGGGSPAPPKKCAGQDVLLTYWWGTKCYADECITQAIEALLAAGAGVIAIAGALSIIGAAPAGLAAGVLALDQAYIQFIDGIGGNNGVIFNQPWIGPGWVWHQ